MTYNSGIPNSTDLISNSQAQIKTNFNQLNSQFGIDHSAFNTGSGNGTGFHKKVTIADVAAPGAQVNPSSILYTKSITGVISLYFRNAVGESVIWRGGTGNGLAVSSISTAFTNGSFTFPNGIIMKWGYVSGATSGTPNNFPVAFPTACAHMQVTGVRGNTDIRSLWIDDYNSSSFTINTSATSLNIQWFAIGN